MLKDISDNYVVLDGQKLYWSEIFLEVKTKFHGASEHKRRRVVFIVDSARQAIDVIACALVHDLDAGVMERARLTSEVDQSLSDQGVDLYDLAAGDLLDRSVDKSQMVPGRITVLTSGTTGVLKLVPHTKKSLNTFDKVSDISPNNWFVPYQIGSYAWYQMVMMSIYVEGQNLVFPEFDDLFASFEKAISNELITAISSTPTFWRYSIMSIGRNILSKARFGSISLGGEIVDQEILDSLRELYPRAAIRHIYASSEAGAAIVVTDGRAGFDVALLARDDGSVSLNIVDGRLMVKSNYGCSGFEARWIDTGDLVEIRDDRVYFCGRADGGLINVGGHKVFAADVEAHLMGHPEVAWVQVASKKAPLVGNLVMARVVLRSAVPYDQVEVELTTHCEGKLADYAVPRVWEFLDNIPLKASLKS